MLPRPSSARNDIVLINGVTKQPFNYKDACVERAPHVGYDPAAVQGVKQSVKDFLKMTFKLN